MLKKSLTALTIATAATALALPAAVAAPDNSTSIQVAACGPCGAKKAGCGANPCAVKKCNPCNPCAAAACNPCNPCAAANPCNPCNPCAAAACNPCNPCNPCAAAPEIELTDAEAKAVYDCIIGEMKAAYAKSGLSVAKNYAGWKNYSRVA